MYKMCGGMAYKPSSRPAAGQSIAFVRAAQGALFRCAGDCGLAHRGDPTSLEIGLGDLQREPSVYLLPECDDKETREHLKAMCGRSFEGRLNDWYRMPSTWPVQRDLKAFDR